MVVAVVVGMEKGSGVDWSGGWQSGNSGDREGGGEVVG